MKKYICVGEQYENGGEKKTSWKRIGEIFDAKSGKQYVKIYHMPNVLLNVFEDEKSNETNKATKPVQDFGDDTF